jgi:drug/metabolite transporter (DMT)-like permease
MLREDRVALISFIVGSVLAGGNAVAVRFSNRELDPLWGAGLRFAIATLVLAAIVALMRLPLPRGKALAGAALYGALNFGGAFALAYYALLHIHAGFGQTLLALVPLVTLLLAVVERQERFRLAAAVGSLIALAGVAVLSRARVGGAVPPLALLAAVGATVCFAQAAVVVRWFPKGHPVTTNAVGMATGAVLLLLGSLMAGDRWILPQRPATWVALGYVVAVGSVIVFVLYLVVLRYWSASRAAYTFVIIPFVTVALSAWLDQEPLGLGLLVGGPLILLGVYVGALRPAVTPAEPDAEPPRKPAARARG